MRSTRPVAVFASMVCALVVTFAIPRAVSAQTLQVIHSFSGPDFSAPDPFGDDNDGAYPRSALVRGPDGSLYGTTTDFPTGTLGTIFRIPLSGAKETLFRFLGPPHPAPLQQGCFPGWAWSLFLAADGAFYGTAGCGAYGDGTLFRITPGGAFTKLHDFDVDGSASSNGGVEGGVVQGSDGNFYGVTDGGAFGYGKVYRLNADGSITTIHDFEFAEGWSLIGNLLLATDGNLYGVAKRGGITFPCAVLSYGCGTIFRLSPDGTVTVVHAFSGSAAGYTPIGNLIQGRDGHLYGTSGGGCGAASTDACRSPDGVARLLKG